MSKLIVYIACLALAVSAQQTAVRNVCSNRQVGTFVRDVQECRGYFACTEDGGAKHGLCPSPYLFDEENQKCNFATLVTCFACPADQAFINLPVPGTCNEYVRCVHKQPEHRICPSDLSFDSSIGQCNLPTEVSCTEQAVPVCPANADPARPIFFRDEEDCSKYTFCLHGTPQERRCPNGLHFNLQINQCDRPAVAGCAPEGDQSFDCYAQIPLEPPLYANPNDCRSGFACAQGVARPIVCAAGTSWNQQVQGCVVGDASCR